MKEVLDTTEMTELMELLEDCSDEDMAAELLRELVESNKVLGALLLNRDPELSHESWEEQCLQAKRRVDIVVEKIRNL